MAYRSVTSSTSRLYANNLKDLLGSLAEQLLTSPLTSDLRIRGPLQFTNIRPPQMQLPLSRDEFIFAFERLAPGLYGEALGILGRQAPEQEWKAFRERLSMDKSFEAQEILGIIRKHQQMNQPMNGGDDLGEIRSAIWELFPDVNHLISQYDVFLANLERAHRRRNFRQLVVIAGLLTFCGNLTLNRMLTEGDLPAGSALFDTHFVRSLLHMLRLREFVSVLSYIAALLLPTVTIAGIADVLDRRLFGAMGADTIGAGLRKGIQGPSGKEEIDDPAG
jgi:hypothetical protein